MKPEREHATSNRQTYFVTSATWGRRGLFRDAKWSRLFLEVLFHYRASAYHLHEFVLMWDHFHLLITPATTLEKAVQFIKGGFSFRAKKQLGFEGEIWQRGFSDHRIRDAEDYQIHKDYVYQNPVKKNLAARPEDYPYSSATGTFVLDPVPQWLKPLSIGAASGTAEAVPFQSQTVCPTAEAVPFQGQKTAATARDERLQSQDTASRVGPALKSKNPRVNPFPPRKKTY